MIKQEQLFHKTGLLYLKQIYYMITMEKHSTEKRLNKNKQIPDDGIYTLKVSNFNIQIDAHPFAHQTRYSNQEKILKRRQMVHTSRTYRETSNPQKLRTKRLSNQLRKQPQLFCNIEKLNDLSRQIHNLSPLLREKIYQLRNLTHKKSVITKNQDKNIQNIHFTQYVMSPHYIMEPSVLHSRNKKECPFMKSVKAKNLISRSMNNHRKQMSQGNFKSIQLNNSSKYAVSKRIVISGGNINNNIKQSKNSGNFNKLSRSYVDRRNICQKGKRVQVILQNSENDYKPWQTHKNENMDDDHNITNA